MPKTCTTHHDYREKLAAFMEGLEMRQIDESIKNLSPTEFREMGALMATLVKREQNTRKEAMAALGAVFDPDPATDPLWFEARQWYLDHKDLLG